MLCARRGLCLVAGRRREGFKRASRIRPLSTTNNNIDTGDKPEDSSASSFQFLTKEEAVKRLQGSGISQSFLSEADDSFKITQVSFENGSMSTIQLAALEIARHTSILPRDLVSLHLTSRREARYGRSSEQIIFRPPPTAILPREEGILLSFGHVRAVATRDSVWVLDAHSDIACSFAKDLAALYTIDMQEEAPELIFLEAVLKETVDTFSRRIRLYEPIVDDFLTKVSNEVFSDQGVHLLVPLKDALARFELQVKQCFDCLTILLNDDEEMLKLLLTEQAAAKRAGVEVDPERHQHVELMLSVYSRQLYGLLQEIQYLLGRLQSKQEFVALALAGYRNRLVRMNVTIGILGVATGVTASIGGLFGMNLISGFEDSPMAFYYVSGAATALSGIAMAGPMYFLRGRLLQERAEQRLAEIETLTSALSDMSALDYTVKKMIQHDDYRMDRETFRAKLIAARQSGKASDAEVELLFNVLDTTKDNHLASNDFLGTTRP